MKRRGFLKRSILGSAGFMPHIASLPVFFDSGNARKAFKIGVCDWSIGKGSDIGAFSLAKEIGADGIMVDMGGEENDLHIRKQSVQDDYLRESKKTGIAISSLALGVFNRVPFHEDPRTEEWITDSIDAAAHLQTKVLLLAFFNASDLRNDDARKAKAINILKKVAPRAEAKGVILGIESYLNAAEHLDIISQVGSPSLKVYFDFRNTADAGHDTVTEFKKLGKDMVCELHMKENGLLLDQGTIDWKEVAKAIYDTKYKGDGWMQIEGSIPKGSNVLDSYRHNLGYLRKLFNK